MIIFLFPSSFFHEFLKTCMNNKEPLELIRTILWKSISWFLHWCILSTRFVPVEMKLENNEFFMRILLKDKNSDIFDLLIHLEQSEHFVAHLGTFMNRLLMHCKPLWKVFSCNFLLFDEAEGLWVKQKSIVWGGGFFQINEHIVMKWMCMWIKISSKKWCQKKQN